uniref:Uncharacterized protein n=1 Tax=Avena sativa TaxID=4498 RepID=A0ACD5VY74_AVESA
MRLQELVLLLAAMMAVVRPAMCREQTNGTAALMAEEEWQRSRTTAVLVFGDSIVDPGNNNNLHTQIKANHAPYGKDFINHVATGRFSNGLVPSDFVAQKLHVKTLVASWLNVEHSPEDLLTGVSFASGATGYDPLTPKIVSVITLEQQLEYFDEYRDKLVAIAGEEETQRIIDGAFFFVCAGTDDVANTYFTTPFRRIEYDIPSYVDLLLVGVDKFLRSLNKRGAKLIGFVGLPPIGCVPSQRTVGGGLHRHCEPKRNYAAQLYNSKVQELIVGMTSEPGFHTRVVYLGIYDIILELAENGEKWGFTETTLGCCGTGLIEVTQLCDTRFMGVCDDVSKHVFFDSFHPTERAYKIIVDYMWDTYGHLLQP